MPELSNQMGRVTSAAFTAASISSRDAFPLIRIEFILRPHSFNQWALVYPGQYDNRKRVQPQI
jgi:hypothetical protein